MVLDVFQPYHEDVLITELGNIGIRLNQSPPDIVIEKSTTGGIAVAQQVKLKKMSEKLLKENFEFEAQTLEMCKKEFAG